MDRPDGHVADAQRPVFGVVSPPHTTGATSLATRGLDGRRFPILESQGSTLCPDWFTFQINLTNVG